MAKTLSLLHAGRLTVDPSWAAARHSHPFTEMMVVHGGRLLVRLGEAEVEAGPGDVLHYPPDLAHDERVIGGDGADFSFFALRGGPDGGPPVLRDASGRMRLLVEWLVREHRAGDRRGEALDALLVLLLHEYERIRASPTPSLADTVRELLRRRLAEPLTVEDLARAARMSRAHFIRTYNRATGRTPMQELRQLRVETARDLIITTDQPLKAIAVRVGLGDEHHLSHVFRRVLRVAPGYYRRSR